MRPWDGLLRALGVEPNTATSIRGASGYVHQVLALGADTALRRLIVISPEPQPRVAAMVQADLQAAEPGIHVLTARPYFDDPAEFLTSRRSRRPRRTVSKDAGELLTRFKVRSGLTSDQSVLGILHMAFVDEAIRGSRLPPVRQSLAAIFAKDTEAGLCPLPLYEFSADDLENMLRGEDSSAILASLRAHGIAQYFFPSADQVALGLVDREVNDREAITDIISTVPAQGHPFVEPELVSPAVKLTELVDALVDKNLVAEGEFTLEITPAGRSVRQTVRFKPREGLLSKLINRFNVNLSLKDLFGP